MRNSYPSIEDLKTKARSRLPSFIYEFLDGGIDHEICKLSNRKHFDDLKITPRYLTDVSDINIETRVFGKRYSTPIGISPVGLGNMIWPGAEGILARAAQERNIPYIFSSYGTSSLEEISDIAPDVCWYQMYVPANYDTLTDLINRVSDSGFHVLVVTVDNPAGAKRNREIKSNLRFPIRPTPDLLREMALNPSWSLETIRHGLPNLNNLKKYNTDNQNLHDFISNYMAKGVTKDHISTIRNLWNGPLVLKGCQHIDDISCAIGLGVDGFIISNHGGRQFDAAPSTISSLLNLAPTFEQKTTLMIDSGIRSGLDVVKSGIGGAEMAFSGRSFYWGVSALGAYGGNHVIELFRSEIEMAFRQIGCRSFSGLNSYRT